MPNSRDVKNRIRSVKNIGQITRALEAVSASRVRKAQARVMASREYAHKAMEILMNIQAAAVEPGALHPLLQEREEIETVMIVLITSDRGLAGAFNSNIIRVAQRFAERQGKPIQWVAVGRKGRDALIRAGENVVAEFTDMPDEITIQDISPISVLAKNAFLSGDVDDVFIAYTDFVNTLTQRPTLLGWLPMVPHDVSQFEHVKNFAEVSDSGSQDYEFEPSPEAIVEEIVPRFTDLILYQTFLESKASEHSARMISMRNASDNADQLVDDLTLVYNKARQAAITSEILDIVGGAEALSGTVAKKQKDKSRANGHATNGHQPEVLSAANAHTDDDLTKIEGIGKKMEAALKDAGIISYAQLAGSSEDELRQAIEDAGMRFSPSLTTWAKQASYAARDDWDGLDAYQEQLVAGREA